MIREDRAAKFGPIGNQISSRAEQVDLLGLLRHLKADLRAKGCGGYRSGPIARRGHAGISAARRRAKKPALIAAQDRVQPDQPPGGAASWLGHLLPAPGRARRTLDSR